ncbi:hypothetical protein F4804DRAFT_330101 [Jackrogersella minutella]|nr:hypothetical protein F4804DRAFT_330101 [Jackrogersella minutella]
MKFAAAIIGLAGAANAAATSFADLGNGMYTIPLVNNQMDFTHAIRDPYNITHSAADYVASLNSTGGGVAPRGQPGTCVPQFPTRGTFCRPRKIQRVDYLRAYAKYLDWIETGPDEGWIPKHSCKSLVWGLVVVSACSSGGRNPTCREELVEAMRELDAYCAETAGGDIKIGRWKKRYSRHNIRDGDDLLEVDGAADEQDADEGQEQGEEQGKQE